MCLLAVAHFVYESIIAPSIRLVITAELIMMKDELEDLRKKEKGKLDDEHYRHLRDSINGLSNRIYSLELMVVTKILSEIEKDRDLKARIKAKSKILDDCVVKEARDMRHKIISLVDSALRTNSGGWLLYLVPIAICAGCMAWIKKSIVAIASLPEKDLSGLAPISAETT